MKFEGKLALLICLLMAGCASPRTKGEIEANQRLIRENEQRLATLENNISELNSQISALNNRVYEVRTKTGQRTTMTVVPVTAAAPKASAKPAAPVGRKIEPAKPPARPAAPAKPAQRAVAPAAPKATPAPTPADELGLPPAELPSAEHPRNLPGSSVPVPQGNSNLSTDPTQAVPIPLIPANDLSLPPEQPVTAPAPQPISANTPAKSAPAKTRTAAQGEQAAYNAALNAVKSGRTAEGIRLFRNFLQKYPNGAYAANAEYWIGECLYSQGKYSEALSEFQSVNSAYPSHHKNADALLKAGMTLNKMGDKDGAAEKFRTLIATFPNSEAARRARSMGVK